MTKTFATLSSLIVFALSSNALVAQGSNPNGNQAQSEDPVHMTVDYGGGKNQIRESHHGVIDPVAVPVGQQVTLTLRFERKFAGSPAWLSPLDGGEVALQQKVVADDGTFVFQFRAGNLPGSYRFLISSLSQYELRIYGYDPNHPPGRRSRP